MKLSFSMRDEVPEIFQGRWNPNQLSPLPLCLPLRSQFRRQQSGSSTDGEWQFFPSASCLSCLSPSFSTRCMIDKTKTGPDRTGKRDMRGQLLLEFHVSPEYCLNQITFVRMTRLLLPSRKGWCPKFSKKGTLWPQKIFVGIMRLSLGLKFLRKGDGVRAVSGEMFLQDISWRWTGPTPAGLGPKAVVKIESYRFQFIMIGFGLRLYGECMAFPLQFPLPLSFGMCRLKKN